jgi:hypothetical protein
LASSKSDISTNDFVAPRGQHRRLVDQVRQIRPGHAGSALGQRLQIHIGGERDLPGVHSENSFPAPHIRSVHHDLPVEAPGTQQCGIQHIGTVGGRDEDDALVRLEAVHFDQQLIQGLFPLVVAAAESGAAVPADCVDFIDEDDARRVGLALFEQVAHARGTDADEHLHEVGTRHREERPPGFTGNRLGEQGLAGARRTDEEGALWAVVHPAG